VEVAEGPWPLVGRDAEAAAIRAAFAEAKGGMVLVGGAGVGKTRLAREALTGLAAMGCATEWVAATRAVATIPLGAVMHLLPGSRSPRRPQDRWDELAVGYQVVEHLAGSPRRHGRLVLGVDDAHLLDPASAALVHQLVGWGAAFVVATTCAGAPAPDAVVALWKDGLARRLDLGALPPEAVDRLIGHSLGSQVDAITRRRLHRRAAGSPLLLRELLAEGIHTGALRRQDGVWRWRGTLGLRGGSPLAGSVDARVEAIGAAAQAAVEVVAYGEPLAVRLLERVLAGSAATGALEAAERGGLVTVERSGARQLARLTQPLDGELLRAAMPATRARAVAGGLAGQLLAGPMRRRDDVLQLAVWQLDGGEVAAPWVLLPAARLAQARFDLDLAERLARAAAAAVREAGEAWEARRLLAEVLACRGRGEAAAAALPPAPAGNLARQARWAVTRATILYWGLDRPAAAERALTAADPAPASTPRGGPGGDQVRAARCGILLFEGRCQQALGAAEEIVERPGADQQAVAWAAAGGTAAAGLLGRLDHALALHERGLAALARPGQDASPWGQAELGFAACLALLAAGRLGQARTLAEAGYQAAAEAGSEAMLAGWAALGGTVAMAQGKVATAQRLLREAAVLLEADDPCRLVRPCCSGLAAALAVAGDDQAAGAWLARADRHRRQAGRLLDAWVERDRAWVLAATGGLRAAAGQAQRAAGVAAASGQPAVAALALYDAARLGQPAAAHQRLQQLTGSLEGPLALLLATAAAALAARDGPALDQASSAFEGLGLRLHAAEAAGAAAQAHRRAGRPAPASVSLERAVALAGACEGAQTPLLDPADRGGVLTPREREVVMLAMAGDASRRIAERLSLSTRTVDNYLGRAYAKLGIAGRDELQALHRQQRGGQR
jgi:DNA-binding CsgD family transcriptional regulator